MQTNSFPQVGVWLDQAKARIFKYENGQAELYEIVDSPVETVKRIPGEEPDTTRFSTNNEHISNNEYRKNNITQNEINEYLKLLEQKLVPYEDILIFGPGKFKDQFINHIKENKTFGKKWIAVESADQMTANQLLAFVRDFFNKSVPDRP
ncbi:MAG: hypothetical protein ACXIT9_13930 [Nitritalea sp.]